MAKDQETQETEAKEVKKTTKTTAKKTKEAKEGKEEKKPAKKAAKKTTATKAPKAEATKKKAAAKDDKEEKPTAAKAKNDEEAKTPVAEKKEEKKPEAAAPESETPKAEEAPKKESAKKPVKSEEKDPQVPGEFDWDAFESKGFGEDYNDSQKAEMEKMYEGTLNTITENEVVKGTVVGINERDIILNIGFKSDGLVSSTEFKDYKDLKVGDVVEVYIEEQENAQGQLVLSRRKAKIVKAWEIIQDSYENDKVIEGFVKRRTKGGLIVDVYGVEAFLPGSQIDVKPIRDFDVFVNKTMEVKIVKINYSNDNVVVSHKILIEKDLEAQKAVILNNLEKGQVLEGVIKNMTNFGVFIDLGGVDGLLHITDISWGRINHPEEVLNLDATVKVVVLDFDEDKKRISLGMKQLTEHPWDSLPKDLSIGSKVKGKIVNVADYGAFLEIAPGVEGLIHVSEMSWSQHLRNPQDFINIGDELEAVVLTMDREERKMSLGIKQLTEDPWTKQDLLTKYAVGTKHKGTVRNLTNFGLFIELEEGIDGLVHVSDLSWTKKIKHPSEFVKVGDELEVVVLELDGDNRRLGLGHKQLEENPWDTFQTVFNTGSVHQCTVLNITDKGAVLELPYGIEGFCNSKNLVKEDGSKPEVGERLDFKVTEFSKEEKRILLSHKGIYSKSEEEPKQKSQGKPASKSKTINKINNDGDKSTLGDLEALSNLKDKMDDSDKKAATAKKQEKADAEEKKPVKAEKDDKKESKTAKAEKSDKEEKAEK